MDFANGICKICSTSLKTGPTFTSECSHTFHYNCIFYNLQTGTHVCPTCNALWTQVPSLLAQPPPVLSNPNFNDDEPLPSPAATSSSSAPLHVASSMTVKALAEYPALSKSDKSDSFAVLVSVKAPQLSPSPDVAGARAPLDLVAVLDVSGSMYGHKISLLKQAVGFVIKNLGSNDRLSIVTFSRNAHRLIPLTRMTDSGQNETLRVVNSIRAEGSTNIIEGLQTAVKVLEQRRVKNPVTSIILLSDGQDTDNRDFMSCLSRLPQSIRSNDVDHSAAQQKMDSSDIAQVYTFGFGADHDARALHAIADMSGGMFSYIEAIEVIQDAFAQCLGGLLSVVAQQVEIDVRSGSREVKIKSISSGRYRNSIDSSGSLYGVIHVGDVYAEEQKQFLVYLSVPSQTEEEKNNPTTKLLEVKCSYNNALSKEKIVSETASAEIRRPTEDELTEEDKRVCLEVDREKNRVSISEGIAQAQDMAERGELSAAQSLLSNKRKSVMQSYAAQVGDMQTMSWTKQAEVVKKRMVSKKAYFTGGGRPVALCARISHNYQRAAAQNLRAPSSSSSSEEDEEEEEEEEECAAPADSGFNFQTSMMQQMVKKSQEARQNIDGQNSASTGTTSDN